MKENVSEEGSVRVDLVGGTLDLAPINLVLPDVVTINLATSLKARVELSIDEELEKPLLIESQDYETKQGFTWEEIETERGPLRFILEILYLFRGQLKDKSLRISLNSEAPAGSGLGGSSAMGVTLFKALLRLFEESIEGVEERKQAVNQVHAIEGKILDRGPAGYQDYYPALFGGILALKASPVGVDVEQHYDPDFARALEERLSLISSGISRNSGINNWEVYKSFFDHQGGVREGLMEINERSQEAYQALVQKDMDKLLEAIACEGEKREQLFSGIVCPEVKNYFQELKVELPGVGMKVCGAGGGGCFLVIHEKGQRQRVHELARSHKMEPLDFEIRPNL